MAGAAVCAWPGAFDKTILATATAIALIRLTTDTEAPAPREPSTTAHVNGANAQVEGAF
jgi:hypothetical protein